MKDNNYITILGWMIKLGLSPNELMVYAIVYGFSQDGKSRYTGSYTYLTETLNISKNTAKTSLNKLIEKDLIVLEKTTVKDVVFNQYYSVSKIGTGGQNLVGGVPKFGRVGGSKFGSNNTNIDNTNNIDSDSTPNGSTSKHFKKWSNEDFINDLKQFTDKVPREDLNNFYNFWSESDGSKMRFQYQKTWQTKNRLTTWMNKKAQYEKADFNKTGGGKNRNTI